MKPKYLCLTISFLLFFNMNVFGTLIIMIPTKDGIIVAADSRVTIANTYIDGIQKIRKLNNLNIVFGVTGASTFLPLARNVDPVEYFKTSPRLFNALDEFEKVLMSVKPRRIDTQVFTEVIGKLIPVVQSFLSKNPSHVNILRLRGKEIFNPVLAQFNPKTQESTLASAWLTIGENGSIEIEKLIVDIVKSTNEVMFKPCGEREYFMKTVLQGPGRQYLGAKYFNILNTSLQIATLDYKDGAFLAITSIEAASKTTEIVPTETKIGGPIKIYLITGVSPNSIRELENN